MLNSETFHNLIFGFA